MKRQLYAIAVIELDNVRVMPSTYHTARDAQAEIDYAKKERGDSRPLWVVRLTATKPRSAPPTHNRWD